MLVRLPTMAEIQKSDPRALRTALVFLAGAALLGVVLITTGTKFRPDLEGWVAQDVRGRSWIVIAALTLFVTGPALGISGYLAYVSQRIIRTDRYPPPGLRTLGDRRVVVGAAAVRRARFLQLLAAVVGVAGLLLAFFLWRLLVLLEARAA
jgi:hypothetical protein